MEKKNSSKRRSRGTGEIYQRKYQCRKSDCPKCADGQRGHKSPVWTIQVPGAKDPEYTGLRSREAAEALLLERRLQTQRGEDPTPRGENLTMKDLMDAKFRWLGEKAPKRNTLRPKQPTTIPTYTRSFNKHILEHLKPERRLDKITFEDLTKYVEKREAEGAARNTLKMELSAIRHGYTLVRDRQGFPASRVPAVPTICNAPANQGTCSLNQFERLLSEFDIVHEGLFACAYHMGWRTDCDLLSRRWDMGHINFEDGFIYVLAGEGKTGRPKAFPMIPELRTILQKQRALALAIQKKTGKKVPWVFPRMDGSPIKRFDHTWREAVARASEIDPTLAGMIPHNFRRTAVINMTDRGIPTPFILEMVGMSYQTYLRYHVIDKTGLRKAGEKMQSGINEDKRQVAQMPLEMEFA